MTRASGGVGRGYSPKLAAVIRLAASAAPASAAAMVGDGREPWWLQATADRGVEELFQAFYFSKVLVTTNL